MESAPIDGCRQVRHVRARRRLGLCAWGGCKARTQAAHYCALHADAKNTAKRLRRAKRRALATVVPAPVQVVVHVAHVASAPWRHSGF